MPKTVLAMTSVNVDGKKALERYLSVVTPFMEAAGAKLLHRYDVSENLVVLTKGIHTGAWSS